MSRLTRLLRRPRFRTGDYKVTRTEAPTFTAGAATPGATSTFRTGDASMQPLEGADLQNLPQGIYASDSRKLYTTATLRLVPVPDVVDVDGEAYTVVGFDPFTGHGGAHSIVYLSRRPTP